MLTDPVAAARNPELAVLSAIAHSGDEESLTVIDVLVQALASVDVDHAVEYAQLVSSAVSHRLRAHLEEMMAAGTFEYATEYFRGAVAQGEVKGKALGEARGRAAMVVRVLERRGIDIHADARARITECTDIDQLETWFDRAVTASSAAELFDR